MRILLLITSEGDWGYRINVPVAQPDRAFACGAKGRVFESPRGHKNTFLQMVCFLLIFVTV